MLEREDSGALLEAALGSDAVDVRLLMVTWNISRIRLLCQLASRADSAVRRDSKPCAASSKKNAGTPDAAIVNLPHEPLAAQGYRALRFALCSLFFVLCSIK